MEIDVTRFLATTELGDISASQAELGKDAGRITWANANREAAHAPILETPDALATFRDYAETFGAWDREHIDAWTKTECNALALQMVAGDAREMPEGDGPGGIDWHAAEAQAQAGQISGALYCGDDWRIFYYFGS